MGSLSQPSGKGLPLGLTGATAATRYVGATASGAPGSGTFAVGDFIIDQGGTVYVCTVAGTPGTWTQVGGSSTPAFNGARILNDNGQNAATGDNVSWDTQVYDTNAYWAIGTPTGVFAPSDGYYRIACNIEFAAGALTFVGVIIGIVGQGEDAYGTTRAAAIAASITVPTISRIQRMDQGDSVVVSVNHDKGSALTITGAIDVQYLGA